MIKDNIATIRKTIPEGVTLVCVSKFKPVEAVEVAYACGERDFGESRVQELLMKYEALPKDIRWHFIGHLQTNKVKAIIPFVHLIQSVDSWHLLETIEREAEKEGRVVDVLLELHVAKEETKSGMTIEEFHEIKSKLTELKNVQVKGLMTMATNTDDEEEIRRCFEVVRKESEVLEKEWGRKMIRSYGMSDDYMEAVACGTTMVRIGSSIFGNR